MRRIHILAEGQTEETIIREVLAPYLFQADIYVTQSVLVTKRSASGGRHRGGVTSWRKFERDVRLLLRDSSLDVLTTLVDYYGLPPDTPGRATRSGSSPYGRVEHVERCLAEAVGDRRFLPHLALHEVEAWVLAACEKLEDLCGEVGLGKRLRQLVDEAGGPELVDDGPQTAPSKRLLDAHPQYVKTVDGPLVVADAGLDAIRADCPHTDTWLSRLLACG